MSRKRTVTKSQEFAESIINTVREPLIALDQDLRVVSVSRSFYEFFKVKPEETVGQLIYDLGNKQWDIPKLRELLETILPEKTTFDDYEVEHNFATIGRRIMLLNARQIQRAFGKERIILLAIEDITERKEIENGLKKAHEKLKELAIELKRTARVKSEFLANMSHELRTPLNSIIGFTGIVLQGLPGPLNAEQTKQLGMVQGSARHLLDLINDILDLSKIEAGQLEVEARPFDIRESVERVMRLVTLLAEKKQLTLTSEVSPDVGELTSDRRRFEQILINLLNNALKFSEKGQVRVECAVNGRDLVTRVKDTGMGIRPEDLGKLFHTFQQIDTGLTRNHEGSGLGLSICKELAEMMGGKISVESEWGVGSTFTFTLPLGQK